MTARMEGVWISKAACQELVMDKRERIKMTNESTMPPRFSVSGRLVGGEGREAMSLPHLPAVIWGEVTCMGRQLRWRRWKTGQFCLERRWGCSMVTGTILPEVKRCLCRAPPPPKSAWRQTETTMSGLRMYTQGPAALLCSPVSWLPFSVRR